MVRRLPQKRANVALVLHLNDRLNLHARPDRPLKFQNAKRTLEIRVVQISIVGRTGNDGDDTITGGDGSDTFFIDLFSANGSDTINDFVIADDAIDLDIAVTGGVISNEEAVAATAAVASTADNELYVFADATQDITGTAGSGIADFSSAADVATFLDTAITAADGHEYLAILNDAAGTTAYVYHVAEATENDADDDITSGDLTLLATVTTDAAITTGETIIA